MQGLSQYINESGNASLINTLKSIASTKEVDEWDIVSFNKEHYINIGENAYITGVGKDGDSLNVWFSGGDSNGVININVFSQDIIKKAVSAIKTAKDIDNED